MSSPDAAGVPVAVFASGSGTNFQSFVDLERRGARWRIELLVSDREEAGALERARRAGVPARVVPVGDRDPGEVGEEILALLRDAGIRLVLLAGYLRLVPTGVVDAYRRRVLNVHPALLPAFGGKGMYGLRVHRAVLEAGVRVTGPTVHFVDERYDEGLIVAQWPVPVLPGDTAEALQLRVLAAEHRLYPLVVDHVCRALVEGREPGPFELGPFELGNGAYALVEGEGGAGLDAAMSRRFQLDGASPRLEEPEDA